MNTDDQLLRAHATISSLRSNVPDEYEVEERWVREFNGAVDKISAAQGIDLQEFKVPNDALYPSVSSSNYLSGEVRYRDGLWCRREVLIHKVDAILTYFTGLRGGQDGQIGFRGSDQSR